MPAIENFLAAARIIATLFTKTTRDYCWRVGVGACAARPRDTPVICHWPFTDFGQIRGDSGRDAGNLL